jgi:hypothetical protein
MRQIKTYMFRAIYQVVIFPYGEWIDIFTSKFFWHIFCN